MSQSSVQEQPATADHRYRRLTPFWKWVLVSGTVLSLVISVYQLFNLGRFGGFVAIDTQYFYALLAVLLPMVFLIFPANSKTGATVPIYDIALALIAFGVNIYFLVYARDIVDLGWEYAAPDHIKYAAIVLWLLALEAVRRAGGPPVFLVVFVVSLYPVYADYLPVPFDASNEDFTVALAYHAVSSEGIFGIPFRAFANLVIGFLMFGVALQYTGGGTFFLNLAFALLGHVRGGPAKVAIFASGLMGSMSGSVITNVLTTGALSIPAMKRTGFSPHYAGGVEACASTGGVLMPPIMGSTAFVMATYLEVPYSDIVIAAVIPSVLYFFGLFIQIDSYAARMKLEGLPKEEMPSVRKTLFEGWHYVTVFALLIWMLMFLQREALAPYYATVLLIVINQFIKASRWDFNGFIDFIVGVGRLFVELAAILAGIGMIVGALSLTGKISTLANELLSMAGDSVVVLLMMGALASFIMGIGVTVTVAYIILAITLAPALTESGLNPMAVHLFMLYWGMLSFITPPVALGAFAAASLAQAKPMRTGFEAMRLGSVIYFIPFFFVLNPALIMQGEWGEIINVFSTAVIGIILLAGALQGYLLGVGNVATHSVLQWPIRGVLLLAALLFAVPGGEFTGYANLELALAGAVVLAPAVALTWFLNRGVAATA
ncbi:MAG: TRAP transporter fused permease subunit [Rhodospirillaceae bacterium]|jgi:TRAP transporter 4TM/12TM fusion protein|nr:TRAP transporter fused permease subunit [Rhodospirillaceae bacterium]MBT4691476.1 TRAP transporter fused permease subunit [Rhodospirillaceae bacterium]MBT5082979.1 TRAP transporter fused permease subunit [Rhodospirillaceae bacterium]MBT5524423.1 TRAP transporter fused permease subunit [Rhodospirillaceae bacterium]MBT5878781.1 TRAP transporter fused permease subunit [Rhodospirillaceae bacterium]